MRCRIATLLLLFLPFPLLAAPPWVRSYDEDTVSLTPVISSMGAGRALVAVGDKRFTIDESGTPQDAILLNGWLQTATPAGTTFVVALDVGKMTAIKLDAKLEEIWRNVYTADTSIIPYGVAAAKDGGLLIPMSQANVAGVIRLDEKGGVRWSKLFDASGNEHFNALRETRDGGCVAVGNREGNALIVKLDAAGMVQWHRAYSYVPGAFISVLETRSGEIVATGRFNSRLAVVKLAANGTPVWQKHFPANQKGFGVVESADGSIFVGSRSRSSDDNELMIAQLRSDGTPGWKRMLAPPKQMTLEESTERSMTLIDTSIVVAIPALQDDRRALLLALDATSGASSCDWFKNAVGDWTTENIAGEQIAFNETPFAVNVKPEAAAQPVRLTMASTIEACEGAASQSAPVATFEGQLNADRLFERYVTLLKEKKYDELDAEGDRLRRERPISDPFWWDIDVYYNAFVSVPNQSEKERIDALRGWAAARPKSVSARVALAKAFTYAAFQRRGTGFADTVTDQAWADYERLLRESRDVLDALGKAGEVDPHYWLLRVRLEYDLADADPRVIARRAAAKGHHLSRIYREAADLLLPKWGGSPALYLAFMDEVAKLTRPTFGDGLYAMLAMKVMIQERKSYATDYEPKIQWARIRQGYRDLIALSPKWLPTYHDFAATARAFNDRTLARELFQQPQLTWYAGAEKIWDTRRAYDTTRTWALTKPVESFLESGKPAANVPPIVTKSDIPEVATFLLETTSGTVGVSVAGDKPRISSSPGKLDVHPLKLLPADRKETGGRYFIVGCAWKGNTCVQTIREGVWGWRSLDPSGKPLAYDIFFREPFEPGALIGGVVLNEDGYAFAVVTKELPPPVKDYSVQLRAHDLSYALSTPAAAAAPAPAVAPGPNPKAPFITQPFEKWPAIVLQNEIVVGSGTYRHIGAFLLHTRYGILAISVVPDKPAQPQGESPILQSWQTLKQWTMWSPLQPDSKHEVAALVTNEPHPMQRSVAVRLGPIKGPTGLQILDPLPADQRPPKSGRCYVVGCVWTEDKCTQTVIEASVFGLAYGPQRTVDAQFIALTEQRLPEAFVGGAVLNEAGYVIAVLVDDAVIGPKSPTQFVQRADAIGVVVPATASLALPRPSPGTSGGN